MKYFKSVWFYKGFKQKRQHIFSDMWTTAQNNAQVSLCQMYCRTWMNVTFLKFVPILVGERTNQKFFIWARFFFDNSKITIRHVRSQVDKVRIIFANNREWACKVNSNFSRMIWIEKNVTSYQLDTSAYGRNTVRINTIV